MVETKSGHYGIRMGLVCAVHAHDCLVPVESHHIWPVGDGGPNRKSNRVDVCANGHSSIHGYLDLLIRHDGEVPWMLARMFGPKVRELAQRGYDQIQAALPK